MKSHFYADDTQLKDSNIDEIHINSKNCSFYVEPPCPSTPRQNSKCIEMQL